MIQNGKFRGDSQRGVFSFAGFFVENFGFEMTIRCGFTGLAAKKTVGVFWILDHELRPSLSRPFFLLGICFDKRFFWGNGNTCYDEKRCFYFQRGWKEIVLRDVTFQEPGGCYDTSKTPFQVVFISGREFAFVLSAVRQKAASHGPKKSVVGNVFSTKPVGHDDETM